MGSCVTSCTCHSYTWGQLQSYIVTQIHRYTDTQLHSYTDTQLYSYTVIQLHSYTYTIKMNRKTRTQADNDFEGQLGPMGSILSGGSVRSRLSGKDDRGVTCQDIRLIMPTVCILLFTVLIMVTVIPYAFSSVIKQLQAVRALEEAAEGGGGDPPGNITE